MSKNDFNKNEQAEPKPEAVVFERDIPVAVEETPKEEPKKETPNMTVSVIKGGFIDLQFTDADGCLQNVKLVEMAEPLSLPATKENLDILQPYVDHSIVKIIK